LLDFVQSAKSIYEFLDVRSLQSRPLKSVSPSQGTVRSPGTNVADAEEVIGDDVGEFC